MSKLDEFKQATKVKGMPEVLMLIYLDEIAGRLTEIYASMQKSAVGVVEPLSVSVADKSYMVKPSNPWISFTAFNDGPDPVYINVNEKSGVLDTPLNSGDDLTVNMETAKIHRLYLQCDKGKTASVRIFAKR